MADIDDNLPVPRGPLALLLTAAFFISPLLFFTNLTRNPYYLQITLLNISLLGAAALFLFFSLKRRAWLLPRTPADKPLAALAAVYLVSFLFSLAGHERFFWSSMFSEWLRAALFFLVNCLLVFYLSFSLPFSGPANDEIPAGKWTALVLVWGGLWFLFPWVKAPLSGPGLLANMLDPYGALLWTGGISAVYLLVKRCRQEDVLHLALSVGAVASLYGVLEYFHIELIWAKLVNPYGNRSVSTFGNPNFISSYVVLLLPLAAWRLVRAGTAAKRVFYGLVFFSYEGMLMASLTRSSWLGAAAGLLLLGAFALRSEIVSVNKKFLSWFFVAAFVLMFAWPSGSLKPFSSGLIDRISEVGTKLASPSAATLSVKPEKIYASFHQRLLIWTSAWQMGLQNPLLGNGWGQFELFYPFFQGRLMVNFPSAREIRTHANNAHNEILEQWSQAGLLGLGVYLWLLAVLFYGFYRFYRLAPPEAGGEAAALAAGLAGVLVDNILNVSLHFAVPALAFWWVAGALSRLTCGQGAGRPQWKRPAAAAAAVWLLLACCLAGAWYWQRQFTREIRYFSGFKAMRSNKYSAAAAELFSAWKAHPREVNSNYEMGNAYVRTGDLEKGAWAYSEALKSNAGYDEIYFNLAIILKRLGRQAEALKYLRVSSFINPLNPLSWQALAEVYLAMPDKAALAGLAAADFEEAAKISPYNGNTWNTLGYFYTLKEDYPAARSAYSRGIMFSPENNMLPENLAGVCRRLGLREDPALQWLTRYSLLTKVLNGPELAPGTEKAMEELLARAPQNLKARTLRAKYFFKAGRLPEARADLEAVLRENYADNSARYGLAVIYEKEGNSALARAEWARFLQLEPGNAAVASRLAGLPR